LLDEICKGGGRVFAGGYPLDDVPEVPVIPWKKNNESVGGKKQPDQ
jgi:hypothetical protein